MKNLVSFGYQGNLIRVVTLDGEPWFVAKDVAERLGYVWNGSARIDHVPADWRGVTSVVTPSGAQEMAILSEAGVFFFLSRSDKPDALPFQRWVAGDVLPSIRRMGSYSVKAQLPDFENPVAAARAWADEREGRQKAEGEVLELAPKALVADRIANAEGLKLISEIGKINGIGPYRIFNLLEERGIIFRRRGSWFPYQDYIDAGYMVVKERPVEDVFGVEHLRSQAYVTGKGEVWLAKQLFRQISAGVN